VVFYCQITEAINPLMKQIALLLLFCSLGLAVNAQKKKSKTTTKTENFDTTGVKPPVVSKSKGKNKGKIHPSQVITDYVMPEPKMDTAKKFIGIIKYRMTTDDPASNDSIFVVFGENKIRVRIFNPGYLEGQFFETTMIANFTDSTFTELDVRNYTYTTEKLSARNDSTELTIMPTKKIMPIIGNNCAEFKGQMITKDQDEFEAACLLSPNHYFGGTVDYNFLGIHPIVFGYQIALGFRSKTSENENTFIMAYKIEPGNTDSWFDLSQYHLKK
jgi:hypothetical protein